MSNIKYQMSNVQFQKGFTLIELLLVIAIISAIGVMSATIYSRFLNQNSAANSVDQLVGQLRKAQIYSMMGRQNTGWGVALNSGKIILFAGSTFATRNTALDESFTVNPTTTIGGFTEIDYAKATGLPNTTASVTISNAGNSKTVTVNNQGVVSK